MEGSLYNHYKIITLFVRYQKNLSESSDGNYSIRIERLSFPIFVHNEEKYVCLFQNSTIVFISYK